MQGTGGIRANGISDDHRSPNPYPNHIPEPYPVDQIRRHSFIACCWHYYIRPKEMPSKIQHISATPPLTGPKSRMRNEEGLSCGQHPYNVSNHCYGNRYLGNKYVNGAKGMSLRKVAMHNHHYKYRIIIFSISIF